MQHSLRLCAVIATSVAIQGPALADNAAPSSMPQPQPFQLVSYPEQAKKKGIEGCAYVSFMINKKGRTEDVKVEKATDYFEAPARKLFKKIRFDKPVEGANNKPIGPFYGLLHYGLLIRASRNGQTETYGTDWQCPFEHLKIDLPARMSLIPDQKTIFDEKFPLANFKLISVE